VFTLSLASGDVRPVSPGDGVTVASFINPTIDAGIWNPRLDAAPPTPPRGPLPRTGSGHTALLLLVGSLSMLTGLALVVPSRRRRVVTLKT
jgi:LPXTG-motif cell wall-anchored protein